MRLHAGWVALAFCGLAGCSTASPWEVIEEPVSDTGTVPVVRGGYHLLETVVTTSSLPTPVWIQVFLPDGPTEGGRVFMRPVGVSPRYVETFAGMLHGGSVSLPVFRLGMVRLDVADPCLTATFEEGAFLFDVRQGDVIVTPAPTQRFCPIEGSEPTAVVVRSPVDVPPGPLTSLEVLGALVDPRSLTDAVVRVGSRTLPLTYAGDERGGSLRLPEPVALGESFTVEIPDVRTVLGTPADVSISALGTHEVLTDLTLTSPPPEGAVSTVGYPLAHEDGALVLNDEGRGVRWSPFAAVLALGDVGASTSVRVSGAAAFRDGGATMMSLYRAGSVTSSVAFTGDLLLAMPAGEGPVWLAITNRQAVSIPNDRTGPFVFRIDAIALE